MAPSAPVPRRHAAITPVKVPTTIANSVPSSTIGSVFAIAVRRFFATGCEFAKETPKLPWRSCCR